MAQNKNNNNNTQFSPESLKLQNLLLSDINNKLLVGHIKGVLGGIEHLVESKDNIGGFIQDWLYSYSQQKEIKLLKQTNSQEFPDYYLVDDNLRYLEVKSFDKSLGPGFDIANFDTYTRHLIEDPTVLYGDYIVFEYTLIDGTLKIENVYLKKVWELTGEDSNGFLTVQRKQGKIYNVRPKNFTSSKSKKTILFNSDKYFIECISKTVCADDLKNHKNERYNGDWLNKFKSSYLLSYNSDF